MSGARRILIIEDEGVIRKAIGPIVGDTRLRKPQP